MRNDARRSSWLIAAASLAAAVLMAVPVHAQIAGTTDVDISQRPGGENEEAVAKNPANPNQIFIFSNLTAGVGLFAARSTDGGVTYIYPDPTDKTIADGDPGQGPAACCDPTAAWDNFGNLFITYISSAVNTIETILSTDGGATFTNLASFAGSVDQPTVVAGQGAVWIIWNQSGQMVGRGAPVTGLGTIGAFVPLTTAPGSGGCSFGDVAIGPGGIVAQVCGPSGGQTGGNVNFWLDADGLGPGGWAGPIVATTTNVGGFDFIPAQNSRSIDSETGLQFDVRPASPHFGRLYLVYTEEPVQESSDTEIFVRFSDNNGTTWSAPTRANDDATVRSQFNPKMSFDELTGNLGICWHDCRDSATNTQMRDYCTATGSAPPAPAFLPNASVGDGLSLSVGGGVEFGDYSGMDYINNVMHPAWADSSNSTGNNPNGTSAFDICTDRVTGNVPVELIHVSID